MTFYKNGTYANREELKNLENIKRKHLAAQEQDPIAMEILDDRIMNLQKKLGINAEISQNDLSKQPSSINRTDNKTNTNHQNPRNNYGGQWLEDWMDIDVQKIGQPDYGNSYDVTRQWQNDDEFNSAPTPHNPSASFEYSNVDYDQNNATDYYQIAQNNQQMNDVTAKPLQSNEFNFSKAISQKAREFVGDTNYGYEGDVGLYNPYKYKCNKFVFDIANAAGAKVPANIDENGNSWAPLVSAWGDPNMQLSGWVRVDNIDDRKEGDIIAQSRVYEDATGHIGIISNDLDKVISARHEGVTEDKLDQVFPDNYGAGNDKTGPRVLWRYIGTGNDE